MFLISLKILTLLWLVNLAPPLLTVYLDERWNAPVDGGRPYRDGKPLFGPNKTWRGIVAAVVTSAAVGVLFGFSLLAGTTAGILAMAGDLASSFCKRRMGFKSGNTIPGFDQFFEGLCPLLFLAPQSGLDWGPAFFVLVFFCIGAFIGSHFLNTVLRTRPFAGYPRALKSLVRLREFRSCRITEAPFYQLANFEDVLKHRILMGSAFRLFGLYKKGMLNAMDIRVNRIDFAFPDLPPAFDGYTILFLSDLHLDGLEGLPERIGEVLRKHPADLCLLGGDYRMETYGPFTEALEHLRGLIPQARTKDGVLGILGNHDCPEIIAPVEACGMKFLVNEAKAVERNGQRIWIVGADDPHLYRSEDLDEAFSAVPRGEFSILAVHSNEIYKAAAKYGPRLYLCGHTHAGQIRLPRIGAVFTHSSAPRKYCQGVWEYEGMTGYTSSGIGVSGVPLRFFSRGEAAFITLRRRPQ